MNVLMALLSIAAGLALLGAGYRLARIIIPIWGFITGLSIGGAIVANMSDTPVLGSVLGITVGIFLGLALALLAYLYYSVAIVILVGSLGYWVGSGFILLLGLSPGIISATAGIVLGIIAGILAIATNAPKYVLIGITAIAGAGMTIGGILLLFNQIPLDLYSFNAVRATINGSWLWLLLAIGLTAASAITQARSTADYELEVWSLNDHTHEHMPPTHHTSGVH